jgi:NADH-quinone oxidoreductase subunit J
MADQILFYFFAGLAVLGAIGVVTARNAVYSAIALITTLLATAGIYLQLRAEFLFAVQVILYVGGIMVLFVFVIMLVDIEVAMRRPQFSRQKWVALLVGLALAAQLGIALYWGRDAFELAQPSPRGLEPNTERVARVLFANYMLPFEIASILLLVAMIGAVVMAKRRLEG